MAPSGRNRRSRQGRSVREAGSGFPLGRPGSRTGAAQRREAEVVAPRPLAAAPPRFENRGYPGERPTQLHEPIDPDDTEAFLDLDPQADPRAPDDSAAPRIS